MTRRSAALLAAAALGLVACADDRDPRSADPPSAPDPSPASSRSVDADTRPPASRNTLSAEEQAELDAGLREAAWANDVARARRLIGRGADVNAKDDTQQSAYLIATSEGHYELLELALGAGAIPDDKDSFNGTGIIRAAERGHWRIVGRLAREGVPVDHVNNLGWTGLHESIILGEDTEPYRTTVRVLVAAGANVGLASERDGVSPVQHARARGFTGVADLLQRAGTPRRPDPSRADRDLLAAARDGDADAAALALRAGARPNTRDERERTPLLWAATNDHVEVARVLIALGADPDAVDDRQDTPWLVTGVTGSVAMLEVLLPAHPDLALRNRFGGISVIPASERGHVAYVRRVVRTGIDVNHVNDLGWTALLEAVILGDGSARYQEIVRILLAAGADPDIPDGDGVTARDHAQRRGFEEVARILAR